MPYNLVIDSAIEEKFPHLQVAVITGELTDSRPDPQLVQSAIDGYRAVAMQRLEEQASQFNPFSQHPHVAAWRQAYSSFGVKAKRHPPTHEALAKRLLKGQSWPDIIPIVDVYLANQIEWLLPHGGYDSDYLSGDITLRIASEGLSFTALGSDEAEPVPTGEVIYTDDDNVLTRRWNYRDCDAARLRESTQRFWLAIESPDNRLIDSEKIHQAAEGLADKLRNALGASAAVNITG